MYVFFPSCLTSIFLPQIVNGPEVLSKYVGETEKNVRDLFADAENEQKARGMVPQEKFVYISTILTSIYFIHLKLCAFISIQVMRVTFMSSSLMKLTRSAR
jgi:hypothetical protein